MSLNIKRDEETGFYRYSFDLSHVDAIEWRRITELFGLTNYSAHTETVEAVTDDGEDRDYKKFVWFNNLENTFLATGCNPLTGEFKNGEMRDKGYCSYIAVKSKNKKRLKAIVWAISDRADHIKDSGQGFMGIRQEVIDEVTK